MSLAVLADHMASKGRGPDSMLIHMSPREVQGLQALAKHHGGTLTINPETGLPEANFLEKLLPTIIGAGISYFSGGTIDPMTAAAMVGGVETARTGDIGRGISAGFQAYGGATLTGNLTAAGGATLGAESAAAGLTMTPELAAELQIAGEGAKDTLLQQQVTDRMAAATPFEKLSAGLDSAKANPLGTLKANAMPLMMAAGPAILAGADVQSKLPQTVTKPGMIAPYASFGGQFVAGAPYQASPTRAAGGGLMGMDDGGYSPGQLDFTQRSEPVVRMAAGGVPGYAPGGFVPSDEDIFNYFKTPGLTDEIIARDMRTFNLSPADIARATGTQNQLTDYEQRFAAQAVPEPVAAPVDYFAQQFAPDVFAPVDTSPVSTPTASAASYTPNRAAIEPEDTYVAPAGIEALAATLPTAAPIVAPVTTPITSTPVVTAPETSGGLAALSTAPTYNKYTNEEIAKYLVDNPNVDIAKAIK
jgi:hypothetical protein